MVADLEVVHLTEDGNDIITLIVCCNIAFRHQIRSPDYYRRSRSRSPRRQPSKRHTPTPEKPSEKLATIVMMDDRLLVAADG